MVGLVGLIGSVGWLQHVALDLNGWVDWFSWSIVWSVGGRCFVAVVALVVAVCRWSMFGMLSAG